MYQILSKIDDIERTLKITTYRGMCNESLVDDVLHRLERIDRQIYGDTKTISRKKAETVSPAQEIAAVKKLQRDKEKAEKDAKAKAEKDAEAAKKAAEAAEAAKKAAMKQMLKSSDQEAVQGRRAIQHSKLKR